VCYEEITCPRCSSLNIKKNGKTANRKQRYLCKNCRRQFITDYTYLGCANTIRELIVPMTLNGAGIRDTARFWLLSPNTVLKTIRETAAAPEQTATAPHDLLLEIGRDAQCSNQALHSLPERQAASIVKHNRRFYQLFFYLKSALTVCSSKRQALQLTSGLDFLSIQAYRLWMEHPSREKVNDTVKLNELPKIFFHMIG
jgi:transposase-like protein